MKANMWNDGWYLVDLETTGVSPTRDDIVAVRIAYMAAYEIVEEQTIPVKPGRPLTPAQEEMLGITNEMLSHAAALQSVVETLAHPAHRAPIIAWDEDHTISFLEAAFHLCGGSFDCPYVALESLAALAFGSHLLRSAREIAWLDREKTVERTPVQDEELAVLYDTTLTIFETLQRRGIRAPGDFDRLFGFDCQD